MNAGSVFWLEKIASLLLAAYLEGEGWERVMLSVPPRLVGQPDRVVRTDWARSVKAVIEAGRPFVSGELKPAHDAVSISPTERKILRLGLRSILQDLVGDDLRSPYRYDGIWHDDGGNVDLVAWRGDEVLTVEAKGITLSGDGYSQAAAATSTLSIAAREAGREYATAFGWLLPDDRDRTTRGRGFVETLIGALPEGSGDKAPIFLVSDDGRIHRHDLQELRGRGDRR